MAVIKKITETINNKKTKPKIGYMNTTNAATTHRMPVPSVNNLGNFSYELFLIRYGMIRISRQFNFKKRNLGIVKTIEIQFQLLKLLFLYRAGGSIVLLLPFPYL